MSAPAGESTKLESLSASIGTWNMETWERGVGWSMELVALHLKQQNWLRMDGLST
jgi:hypothetical protein